MLPNVAYFHKGVARSKKVGCTKSSVEGAEGVGAGVGCPLPATVRWSGGARAIFLSGVQGEALAFVGFDWVYSTEEAILN